MKIIDNITVGADPEVLIQHEKTGEYIPAFLITPGDKYNPVDMGGGYQILADNVTLEGNIPPSSSKEGYIMNMTKLIDIFSTTIKANNKDLKIVFADSATFADDKLEFEEAKIFGCMPFKIAYHAGEHVAPDLSTQNKRAVGGHIHCGYNSVFDKEALNPLLAIAFDLFLTIPSRITNFDEFRNKYYGNLGAYRDKDYGVEFRSLGGYTVNPKYYDRIYDNLMKMVIFVNSFPDIVEFRKEMLNLNSNLLEKNRDYYKDTCKKFGINYSQLIF